jgi:hypothetical protein
MARLSAVERLVGLDNALERAAILVKERPNLREYPPSCLVRYSEFAPKLSGWGWGRCPYPGGAVGVVLDCLGISRCICTVWRFRRQVLVLQVTLLAGNALESGQEFFNSWSCLSGTLPQDEKDGLLRYPLVRRSACMEVGAAWCSEPVQQLDPGCSEAPPIVAPSLGSTQTRRYHS